MLGLSALTCSNTKCIKAELFVVGLFLDAVQLLNIKQKPSCLPVALSGITFDLWSCRCGHFVNDINITIW